MTVTPSLADRLLAWRVHSQFARKVGSQHIAKRIALTYLAALLRRYPVRSVIEFGSGIGTITSLLLARLPRNTRIVCAERNEWCRQQFDVNIPASERARVDLLPQGRPELHESFDLVVIDGPVTPGAAFIRAGSIVFVEASRTETWEEVSADLSRRGLSCELSSYSKPIRSYFMHGRRFGVPKLRVKTRFKRMCSFGIVQPAPAAPSDQSVAVAPAAE